VVFLHADQAPARFAAVVLNDVGPEIGQTGLARVRVHVGQGRSFPTWMHAARALREQAGPAYPDFEISDWLRLAKRLMAEGPGGRIAFDYDMKIAEALQSANGAAPADMWPAFRKLEGRPLLVLRGELSDILSIETLNRMKREAPNLDAVTIERVGHVPTLEETAAQKAIDRLLAQVA